MIIDALRGTDTIVFIHESLDKVLEKTQLYVQLANKFISKNKRFQYIKHFDKLSDGSYCLIFKVLPKNHESVKEYNRLLESAKKEIWVTQLNKMIIG
jgi:hypothetical protein